MKEGFPIEEITVLLLTYNEQENIGNVLKKLSWAKQILVIDSGSTDDTLRLLEETPNLRYLYRKFDSFAQQCNFGLAQIKTDWVLSLDADYLLSDALIEEIQHLDPDPEIAGYRVGFIYAVYGKPLRGTIYPPRTVLYRRRAAHYVDEGHGHRVSIAGRVSDLQGKIIHDDRKPLDRWFSAQCTYARREADYLEQLEAGEGDRADQLRKKLWLMPGIVFFYTLLYKGCILDGWPGWFYVMQRTLVEFMIAVALLDRRLRGN